MKAIGLLFHSKSTPSADFSTSHKLSEIFHHHNQHWPVTPRVAALASSQTKNPKHKSHRSLFPNLMGKPWLISAHLLLQDIPTWELHRRRKAGRGRTHLLQAAGEAARGAAQGSLQPDHLVAQVVDNPDGEGPCFPTAIPGKAVCVLCCKVHPLSQGILDFVFVVCFKASHNWKMGKNLLNSWSDNPCCLCSCSLERQALLKVCQRQLLAKGNDRKGASSSKAWWRSSEGRSHCEQGHVERNGDSHLSPVSPQATGTCCLDKHHHYQ